jgi:hypothetical protein
MRNPSSPVARRPGSRAELPKSSVPASDTTASASQRPIRRRAPNRLFRDEVPAPSAVVGLTVDVTGGGCRALEAVLVEEGARHEFE